MSEMLTSCLMCLPDLSCLSKECPLPIVSLTRQNVRLESGLLWRP